MRLIPTILCGGAGSRLWPVSRELHPKPFIRLADGQSLLQKAFLRGALLPNVAEVLTVTNRELIFKTEDEFREVNAAGVATSFILEPFGRNTAPAVAAAALQVAKMHGGDAVMLVLAADHLIADQPAFEKAVHKAVALAVAGKLVTFGIQPRSPETCYGYIEADLDSPPPHAGEGLGEGAGFPVLRFVEKPSLEKAEEYLASGRFLWNSGMFCFTAGAMLQQMEQHCPQILAATRACIERSTAGRRPAQLELDPDTFAKVPDDSIDYAVMEKAALPSPAGGEGSRTGNETCVSIPASERALRCSGAPWTGGEGVVAVVPCNIGWSDIGSWAALEDFVEPDSNGNRIQGEALLHNTRNCTIQSNDRLVGTVGVENLIIIDTPDAVLVADKSRAQDVKHIYAELKAKGHEAYKLHRTVHRPWGTYTVLEEGDGFKIKRIEVKPGASLSLQRHQHRSEHWVVIRGQAVVANGSASILLGEGESTFIPARELHRLSNQGNDLLVVIEVQVGSYVGEDDIERISDSYGRQVEK